MENEKLNVIQPGSLSTDTSLVLQPKGSTRFVLNGVNETDEGDKGFIANEESNEICYELPINTTPIGKLNVGNEDKLLFLVSNSGDSLIAIADKECNLRVLFDDSNQVDKLGFKLSHQIDAVFRLRRGCERIAYWADPKVRSLNIDKLEEYKNDLGEWDINRFSLSKTYNLVPNIESITVAEGGLLPPGSYNISLQYIDEDLNSTEWVLTTNTIKIYNDSINNTYSEIRGSTNKETVYQNFGNTNKSIRVELSNLDPSYVFYRLAFIEATSGTGLITAVKYTQEIPIEINNFTYTGNNFESEGTINEILAFREIIDEADHIEQLENKLLLATTKGSQVNYCNLQKYASKITADLELREIELNTIAPSNPKNPTVDIDGVGYMPGEIYSKGVVYVFEDNSISPVYHIPGRNIAYISNMSSDNKCLDSLYTDNNSCESGDYWGVDSEGAPLVNQKVRHHRFPLRSDLNLPLFQQQILNSSTTNVNKLFVRIQGTVTYTTGETYRGVVFFDVTYSIGGTNTTKRVSVSYVYTMSDFNPAPQVFKEFLIVESDQVITLVSMIEVYIEVDEVTEVAEASGLAITQTDDASTIDKNIIRYYTQIMGIKFGNIIKPSLEDTNGLEVIGYYFVRNERTQEEKTILDSAVLTPLLEAPFFVASGQIMPNFEQRDVGGATTAVEKSIKKDMFGMIHPEHKFLGTEAKNATQIIKQGVFILTDGDSQTKSSVVIEDVMAGTSYDREIASRKEKDGDGFSLHTLTRDSYVNYNYVNEPFASDAGIKEIFYLDALNSKTITDSQNVKKEVFNTSSDNKIGIVSIATEKDQNETYKRLPYVILKRQSSNPYANFRVLPYYKSSNNLHSFDEEPVIFNGDSYVTPMRYSTSNYYDLRLRRRATKGGILNIVLGAIAVIVGVILTIYGGGAAGGLLISYGVSSISSGISKENISRVYNELYEAGLRECVKDVDAVYVFSANPDDDEFQWMGDTVTNLWFESSINMGLRQGSSIGMPDFLNSPVEQSPAGLFASFLNSFNDLMNFSSTSPQNDLDKYLLDKLTVLDAEKGNGRLYKGYASSEIYEINLDYMRINKEKIFSHLGLEYDCCSDCNENFPHRWYWSLDSFQEELTDNYRIFLPNNYKDLEGDTGKITDLFKIQDKLFIHTEDALWEVPVSRQERVTGEIISYIGTGEFASLPARKIVDDNNSSAGCSHKWATLKTKYGVLFASHKEKKWYIFDGQQLSAISDSMMFNYFKQNMKFLIEDAYYKANKKNYPYINNPSNLLGTGYISVYDTKKERLIITKKDFIIENLPASDYELCNEGDAPVIFKNFSSIIENMLADDFIYTGIINCQMVFRKTTTVDDEIITEYDYVDGEPIEGNTYDNSFTLSYSLKDKKWVSWHSYLPNFYLYVQEKFYSWKTGLSALWKHNRLNHYQTFYGEFKPFIVEYVDGNNPLVTKVWESLKLNTEAKQWNEDTESFVDKRYVTFNKVLVYNTEQISGILDLMYKTEDANYINNQITNSATSIPIDRNERDWSLNELRDISVDASVPMFNKNLIEIQNDYFIDKIVNPNRINYNKDWMQMTSFRDKFLVIRLIFDTFDDTRLIMNFSIQDTEVSER